MRRVLPALWAESVCEQEPPFGRQKGVTPPTDWGYPDPYHGGEPNEANGNTTARPIQPDRIAAGKRAMKRPILPNSPERSRPGAFGSRCVVAGREHDAFRYGR